MPDLAPALADRLALRFRSLGDPIRLRILYALMGGERRVSDLVESTAGNQANVSMHLQLLHTQGLGTRRKEGTSTYYKIADPEVFSDVQRFAQIQLVAARAAAMPQLYDLRKVEELILSRTKIPDAKGLLLPEMKPSEMNQVNENAAIARERLVQADAAKREA